ncbi:hypothetical protein [Scale drop disease virus]|nr:hypothetical protein [Scale drop disease virus]QXJ13670.1 ORF078L [Scale drop disease virus]
MVFLHEVCLFGTLSDLKNYVQSHRDDNGEFIFDPLHELNSRDTPLHKCCDQFDKASYLIDVLGHPLNSINADGISPALLAVTKVGLKKAKAFYEPRGANLKLINALFDPKFQSKFAPPDVYNMLNDKQSYVTDLEPVVRATWMYPDNVMFLMQLNDDLRLRLHPLSLLPLMTETNILTEQLVQIANRWCEPKQVLEHYIGHPQLSHLLEFVKLPESYKVFVQGKPLPTLLAERAHYDKIANNLLLRIKPSGLYYRPLGYRSAMQILKSKQSSLVIEKLLLELQHNGH